MSGGDWKDMYRAACTGDLELVRFHLDNGVDVDFAHPEFLSTALVASILEGQGQVAHLLLDHGADPLLGSQFEAMTPVEAAREAGLADLEARLCGMGATPPVAEPQASPGRLRRGLRAARTRAARTDPGSRSG